MSLLAAGGMMAGSALLSGVMGSQKRGGGYSMGSQSLLTPEQRRLMNQYIEQYGPNSQYGEALMGRRMDLMGKEFDPRQVRREFNDYVMPTIEANKETAMSGAKQRMGKNYFGSSAQNALTDIETQSGLQANAMYGQMLDTRRNAIENIQMNMAGIDPASGMLGVRARENYALQQPQTMTPLGYGIQGAMSGMGMAGMMGWRPFS